MVAFGAGERHESSGMVRFVMEFTAEVSVQRHDLFVADALVSGGGEPFPCGFEEVELVVQLALDENPLSTIDLRNRQKLSTRVRVNAQEVSYLVRSAQWGSHEGNGQPERKREDNKHRCRLDSNLRPDMRERGPRTAER